MFVSNLLQRGNAWGRRGHEAIARYAFARLDNNARKYMQDIYGHPVSLDEFISMSVWADAVANRPEYAWSKDLHFTQNSQALMRGSLIRDTDCLLSSVERFASILMDQPHPVPGSSIPQAVSKQDALKFIIHFVGDLHAPFHIGDQVDQNGCEIFVEINENLKRKMDSSREELNSGLRSPRKKARLSLHHVWDSAVVDYVEYNRRKPVDKLIEEELNSETPTMRKQMAIQSRLFSLRRITMASAIKSRKIMVTKGMLDMNGKKIKSGDTLSEAYMRRSCPVVLDQLVQGGKDLALVLNKLADISNVKK